MTKVSEGWMKEGDESIKEKDPSRRRCSVPSTHRALKKRERTLELLPPRSSNPSTESLLSTVSARKVSSLTPSSETSISR